MLLFLSFGVNGQFKGSINSSSEKSGLISVTGAQNIILEPTQFAELLTRIRTQHFVNSTRAVVSNNASALDLIFYRLAAIKVLDPTLSNVSQTLRDFLSTQVLSFQNLDGGFGNWYKDKSSVSSTYKALQVLNWLGYTNYNATAVELFLNARQNSLTKGFVSDRYDSDSDVYTTYLAVKAYKLLGKTPPNASLVAQLFINAQNLNSSVVPNNEIGGFGDQTNSVKNVYWQSKVTTTRAAIMGLYELGYNVSNVIDVTAALNFVKGVQISAIGSFANTPSIAKDSATYTEAALDVIYFLNGTPKDAAKAETYLLSLENSDGGFKLDSSSTLSSLKGTYFAIKALQYLSSAPSNQTKTLEFLLNFAYSTDGFGDMPGDGPRLRSTFDGVAIFELIGKHFDNTQDIISYVESYRNPDGGFGRNGSFTESTLRAVVVYNILGIPFPNASETISFLQSLQQADGGFSRKAGSTVSYVVSTYRAVLALSLLGTTPADVNGAISFLKSVQNSDGGFGSFVGDTSDVTNTYRAIRALELLSDSTYDKNAAKQFLLQSQNSDGGFKRSPNDITLPKNVSNLYYVYSAVRALQLLNAVPSNITGVYDYVKSTRNSDGGFAEHPHFTSTMGTTYAALWILRHFHEISNFTVSIPSDINSTRSQYDNISISVNGGYFPVNYTITLINTTSVLATGSVTRASTISVDTTALQPGNYSLQLEFVDETQAVINATISLYIGSEPDTPPTTVSSSSSVPSSTNNDSQSSVSSSPTSTAGTSSSSSASSNETTTNPNLSNKTSPFDLNFSLQALSLLGVITIILKRPKKDNGT